MHSIKFFAGNGRLHRKYCVHFLESIADFVISLLAVDFCKLRTGKYWPVVRVCQEGKIHPPVTAD